MGRTRSIKSERNKQGLKRLDRSRTRDGQATVEKLGKEETQGLAEETGDAVNIKGGGRVLTQGSPKMGHDQLQFKCDGKEECENQNLTHPSSRNG